MSKRRETSRMVKERMGSAEHPGKGISISLDSALKGRTRPKSSVLLTWRRCAAVGQVRRKSGFPSLANETKRRHSLQLSAAQCRHCPDHSLSWPSSLHHFPDRTLESREAENHYTMCKHELPGKSACLMLRWAEAKPNAAQPTCCSE